MTFGEENIRKGTWMPDEDLPLTKAVALFGERRWDYIARVSGLKRSRKSCRMRWLNYLRPDLKHGRISSPEEDAILQLHARWGNKWLKIASELPGRTDDDIKNYWRSLLRKKTQENQIQRESKAAIRPSDPSVQKENSRFEDYRLMDDGDQRASEGTIDANLPLGLEIYDYPFAISLYEARMCEWASGLMDGHDFMDHHSGFNGQGTTISSQPPWISLNGDIIWEYHMDSLWWNDLFLAS